MGYRLSQSSREWLARQPHGFRGRGRRRARLFGGREQPDGPRAVSQAALPLSLIAAGETVVLSSIRDGTRLRQRIADLGLTIGLTVRVVKNDYHGPLIIAVKQDSRLAIDRELAHRIQTHLEHDRGNNRL